ncbi:unnamed protein product [Calicophoron daubneyi]
MNPRMAFLICIFITVFWHRNILTVIEMSKDRGLSRHSIYRLLWKIAKKTASRLQFFRQRLLDQKHQRSFCPEITTSAITSEQPPEYELENR